MSLPSSATTLPAAPRHPLLRVLAILAGYVFAAVVGVAAVKVRYIGVDPADVMASSGMYAFGDLVEFCGVAGLLSVPSTYFALRELHRFARLWTIASWALLALAVTAVVGGSLHMVSAGHPGPLVEAGSVGLLRTFLSPLLFLFDGACVFAAPGRERRTRLAWAAAMEFFGAVSIVAPFFWMPR